MSRQHQSERAEQAVGRMRARIADHKRGLNRMIVQGCPTQSATHVLSNLCEELILLERRARLLRDGIRSSLQ